jgi:hypothetical protein
MITTARIEQELRGVDGLDWITCLRAPAIRELAEAQLIQPSLFDERDLAEIQAPDYPGERLVACRNPFLMDERRRKRDELIAATERDLDLIVAATRRAKRPLRGAAQIALRIGRVAQRRKVAKYFDWQITDTSFSYQRNQAAFAVDAGIDGIYVVRTSVGAERSSEDVVRAYKGLAPPRRIFDVAERAFRSLKTVDLKVRPIHHRLAKRVRAHVFLCMLAYYVEWVAAATARRWPRCCSTTTTALRPSRSPRRPARWSHRPSAPPRPKPRLTNSAPPLTSRSIAFRRCCATWRR